MNLSFYDISLVDGYNLPIAIQVIPNSHGPYIPLPNETNPSCVGSIGDLAPIGFDPYANNSQLFLGTNSSCPLPFDSQSTSQEVASWCPKDLQLNTAQNTGNTRPPFDPCLSACSKYNTGQYCCTGKYDSAKKCTPNYYSKVAKQVCPDAFSYAFDDASSTFTVPVGAGFEVIFCPGGRSTTIRQTLAKSSAASYQAASLCYALIAMLITVVIDGLG